MNATALKFLVALKNNSLLRKESLIYRYSKSLIQITASLYKEGYIQSFKIIDKNYIYILLRHFFNKPVFKNLKFLSTPSRQNYASFSVLSKISGGKSTLFLSTNRGVLTLLQCKEQKVGGKLLFSC